MSNNSSGGEGKKGKKDPPVPKTPDEVLLEMHDRVKALEAEAAWITVEFERMSTYEVQTNKRLKRIEETLKRMGVLA